MAGCGAEALRRRKAVVVDLREMEERRQEAAAFAQLLLLQKKEQGEKVPLICTQPCKEEFVVRRHDLLAWWRGLVGHAACSCNGGSR